MLTELIQMTPSQRKEFLENNAHTIEEGQYFRRFDDEDIRLNQSEYMEKSIELKRITDEFDQIKADYKQKIKGLETVRTKLMSEMMQNGEWLDGKQYGFDDQILGKMEYYDADGNFINSRRLLPNERQLSINSSISKAQ